MQGNPIHENLSTSFVNFPALLRHLRSLQFVGTVRIELSSWEGEVVFTAANRMQAREYDRLAGRISQGEPALKRIIERSREPMGRINVLRAGADETAAHLRKAFVDDRIVTQARDHAFGPADTMVSDRALTGKASAGVSAAVALAAELILTVKEPFDRARMDFEAAFAAAGSALANDFPFLAPAKGILTFRGDSLQVTAKIPTDELFTAVVAVLSRIIAKMRGDVRFGKLLIYTRHRLQQHFSTRHEDYSRLGLVDTVDRIFA